MHHRPTYPGHLRFARNTTAVLAATLFGYRIIRAVLTGTLLDGITSVATGLALIAATGLGYVIHLRQLRDRAERAEKKVVELRAGLLEGDEDKALWDSVEPASNENAEDTYKFGLNVIAIRFKQAG